jgi:hypothetical protein
VAKVGEVEAAILRVEGFEAHFYRNGNNVRSDLDPGMAPYPFQRAAPGSWTVQEWFNSRFAKHYSGWEVRVRTSSGLPITHWQTKLQTVRDRGRSDA